MGYNRSGTRRTQRLKRHKREQARLAAKAAAASPGAGEQHHEGLVEKVKGVASGVAEAVGHPVHKAVEAVTGEGS
jgi:hypothetical protein